MTAQAPRPKTLPWDFEVGPIRPPNEAASLLLRVTRNCPWNRCTFCPVYKGEKFSLRTVDEVKADIDSMAALAARARELAVELEGPAGEVTLSVIQALLAESRCREVLQLGYFLHGGGTTAFLQDANSLILPFDQLLEVLHHLRRAFPELERVTTYARAHTVLKRSVEQLTALREAGLDRIHIGLESGADEVLDLAQKGITGEEQIEAGQRVKQAGIGLSEYVMPGLGGRALTEIHATETARVLRAIDPHFVRLRSLALPPTAPLAEQWQRGDFEPLDDVGVARELRQLVGGFTGMTSTVTSDHILNLLEEVAGKLPDDHPAMLEVLDRFLGLPEAEQQLYIVGRRLGLMRSLDELEIPQARARAAEALTELQRRYPGPLDQAIRQAMMRFV